MPRIAMVLFRGPGDPAGNLNDRIDLHAGLTPHGQLDAAAWQTGTQTWRSVRQRPGQEPRRGELVKIADGWALRSVDDEDEPICGVWAGLVRPGELVSVSQRGGNEMIYRIVSVDAD